MKADPSPPYVGAARTYVPPLPAGPALHDVNVHRVSLRRPGPQDAVVVLEDVRKTYGAGENAVEALKGVDFAAQPGRLTAIVGPSGSGKSTLLNLLGGLDVPSSGRIWFGDREVSTLSEKERTRFRARNIGFVFQFLNLLPGLTCAQNVALGGVIAGLSPHAARDRAVGLLEVVGLGAKAGKLARDLSGGQMQRVAIARALMNDAPLLLADEPTGNLDESNAEEITMLLRDRATDGRAVVLVTHNNDLAERYADEIRIVRDGLIVNGRHTPPDTTSPITQTTAAPDATAEFEVGPLRETSEVAALLEAIAQDGRDMRLLDVRDGRATFSVAADRRAEALAAVALRLGRNGGVRLREAPDGHTVVELEAD